MDGKPMSTEESAVKMREIAANGDWEAAHGLADDLLCELLTSLGYGETIKACHEVGKWYA